MKKISSLCLVSALLVASFTACGAKNDTSVSNNTSETEQSSVAASTPSSISQTPENPQLEGHQLLVYCGAGMKDAFQKIADTFQKDTGCTVDVVYANAAQIQTQITTAQEGDVFIAGSMEELKPVEATVTSSEELVKHIPVIAVQKGNPLGISGLKDLAGEGVRLYLGDNESTPIGKLSDKALKDAGIMEQVDIVSRSVTAPALATALEADECDAIIVWKENVDPAKVEIVNTTDMEPYVKVIPSAALSYNTDSEALDALMQYLSGDKAMAIWKDFGYEPA